MNVVTVLVCLFTLCWYLTSSWNTIATQQLVQLYKKRHDADNLDANFGIMASLTGLQLLVGWLLAKAALWSANRLSATKTTSRSDATAATRTTGSGTAIKILIGTLHFIGSLSTNLGFAYGTSSIVQTIKLLEPIETLLLMVIVHKCFPMNGSSGPNIGPAKAFSVVVIVSGTSLLLSSPSMEKKVNFQTVAFALLSGLALSSRNVVQKTAKNDAHEIPVSSSSRARGMNNGSDWIRMATKGLENFINVTYYSFGPAILCFLISVTKDTSKLFDILTSTGKYGKEAVLFHGLYNIFSISVLTLVSAPTHSLLNVGKRVFNVLTAAVYFQERLGAKGSAGLLIAAIGGFGYSKSKSQKGNTSDCSARVDKDHGGPQQGQEEQQKHRTSRHQQDTNAHLAPASMTMVQTDSLGVEEII